MAGRRKKERDHAKQVGEKNKDKERKDEGEEPETVFTGGRTDHIRDEFIRHFGNRLRPCRD